MWARVMAMVRTTRCRRRRACRAARRYCRSCATSVSSRPAVSLRTRMRPVCGKYTTRRAIARRPGPRSATRKPSSRTYSRTNSMLRAPMSLLHLGQHAPAADQLDLEILAPPAELEDVVDEPLHRDVAVARGGAARPRPRRSRRCEASSGSMKWFMPPTLQPRIADAGRHAGTEHRADDSRHARVT